MAFFKFTLEYFNISLELEFLNHKTV